MKSLFTTLLLLLSISAIFAQAGAPAAKAKADTSSWTFGGGLGADLTGLGIVNPRLGAGANRIGFGGLISLYAKNKKEKYYWDNAGSLQLAAVRIGGKTEPFQKSADIIRVGSRFGYQIDGGKFFAALDATAETQLLPTYAGNVLKGDKNDLLSQFLSPLRLSLSPGIDYKLNSKVSFFVAPFSLNLLFVGNDSLAILPNQPLGNEFGKNNRTQLGYQLKAQYAEKFLKDRIAVSSKLGWFADYRKNLNGNVLWQNTASIALFKGIALELYGDMFYDHFTQVITGDVPAGTATSDLGPYLGLKPSYIGGFLLKYNRIF